MLNTYMFKAIKKWWKSSGECEEELARLGIYSYTNAYGHPTYLHTKEDISNDRQKTDKRTTKKTKG